jgi:hypothetical protein
MRTAQRIFEFLLFIVADGLDIRRLSVQIQGKEIFQVQRPNFREISNFEVPNCALWLGRIL